MSGCGLDKLTDFVHDISLSTDLSKAVITCNDSEGNGYASYYYCDVAGRKLVPMREMTGGDVSECWLLKR